MINSFWKKASDSIATIQNHSLLNNTQTTPTKTSPTPSPTSQIEPLTQHILNIINNQLATQLGQPVPPNSFEDVAQQVNSQLALEGQIVEAKEKYNELAEKSSGLYLQARKIGNGIGEFVSSLNLFLESQELLVPLEQIQKGINELQAERVERQINYLIRIFENNFQEVVERKVTEVKARLENDLKLSNAQVKRLQGQLSGLKSSRHIEQAKYLEQAMKSSKVQEQTSRFIDEKKQAERLIEEKNKKVEELGKELRRVTQTETELVEKLKQFQGAYRKSTRQLKQAKAEKQAIEAVVRELKQKQEERMEEMEGDVARKMAMVESNRKKIYSQKAHLEEKVERMTERNQQMEKQNSIKDEEIRMLKDKLIKYDKMGSLEVPEKQLTAPAEQQSPNLQEKQENSPIKEQQEKPEPIKQIPSPGRKNRLTLAELLAKAEALQGEKKELETRLAKSQQLGVNRQVLSTLFVSYDDESKEWSVRQNVKHQIYSLLGLKEKIPKAQETKSGGGWFGLF